MTKIQNLAAATASAVLLLAACGGGDGGGDGGGGSGSETLRVWFPGNLSDEITWVQETLVPAFEEENPNVSVEVEFVDWPDLSTRLSTAFAGGTTPDVFGHGNAAAAGFLDAGRIEPLDGYVDEMDSKDRDDLIFMGDGVVDGKQAIMPLRGFGYVLAYRTDLFDEVGLDADKPPETWEDLRSAAEELTVAEGDRIERAGVIMPADNPGSMSQAFGSALFQAGGSFLSEDGSEITWNQPEGVAALDYLAGLYQGPEPVATGLNEATSGAGAQHPLATGRAAMAVLDDATLRTIYEQAPDVAENIAVAPMMHREESAAFGGAGNGMFISADSKLKNEAWSFIEFLLRTENVKDYTLTVGGIPARASLADDPDLAEVPYLKPFMDQAEYFRGNPNVPPWTQLRDVLSLEIEKALQGKAEPADALDAAAEEAGKLLDGDS